MSIITFFADIILPIAAPIAYTYRVPLSMNDSIAIGKRVVVQFGKNKIYTGIVLKIHNNPPAKGDAKYILSIIDVCPIITQKEIDFWVWISNYYMCTIGEVMNTALPSLLKPTSETKIVLNEYASEEDIKNLNDKEYLIWEGLSLKGELTVNDVSAILGINNPINYINRLVEKRIIHTQENLIDYYKPRKETLVELSETYKNNDSLLKEIFESLEKRSPQQLNLLMHIIYNENLKKTGKQTIFLKQIMKESNSNQTALKALVKKGVIQTKEIKISRIDNYSSDGMPKDIDFKLSDKQNLAFHQIKDAFKEKDVVLLHGITGSGKTEVYIKIIEEVIKQGQQVLYLLPEIALTNHIIIRLKKYFGDCIGVYHSKFSDSDRLEVWYSVTDNKEGKENYLKDNKIILGARSAVFMPFQNLGLVIVDKEHDPSYKQNTQAPRYNARDIAIYLAKLHNAKVILGSATPSIESYYNAKEGKYGIARLLSRYNDVNLPDIVIANIKEETDSGTMKENFTLSLFNQIQIALKAKQQVILFQNRRGFAPRIECNVCNWTLHCKSCDVVMTYHKATNQFKCHYCGYVTVTPKKCFNCESTELTLKGFGTEKLEDDISILFPNAKIARMDLDSTRNRNSYHKILADFDEKKIDILIGTQMITKGLDFDNVSLVGVLNADSILSFPDFRANERGFQLITQVTGRAGRKKKGLSIIQTKHPNNGTIQQIIKNDYIEFYNNEIKSRQTYNYPPFARLINIIIKHKDPNKLQKASCYITDKLKDMLGTNRVLGPETPIISKINNYYLKATLIKIDKTMSIPKTKQIIVKVIENTYSINEFKPLRVVVDVDPY